MAIISIDDEATDDAMMKEAIKRSIIDLSNSKPAHKKYKKGGTKDDVIVILSDDDDDAMSSGTVDMLDCDDDDDDIVIVDTATAAAAASARTIPQINDNDDDEVQAIGEKNVMRLPHARQHCTQSKFVQDVRNSSGLSAVTFSFPLYMHVSHTHLSFFYADSYKASQYVEYLG